MVMPTAPDARDMSAEMARRMGGSGRAVAGAHLHRAGAACSRQSLAALSGSSSAPCLSRRSLRAVPLEALGGCRPPARGRCAPRPSCFRSWARAGRRQKKSASILARWALAEPEVGAPGGRCRPSGDGHTSRR